MTNKKLSEKIKPIFVIGAMKSGTTTLFNYLEQQEEICFAITKEPEYFSKKMGLKKYKSGSFWDLYDIKSYHKFIFDGSTGYTKYPVETGVAKRIYDYDLRPKFIYVVRNPFDRIESHYNFMKKNIKWKANMTSEHLINVSNYYLQLKQFTAYFDRSNFLIIDFDELTNNPKLALEKLANHLGLSKIDFKDTFIKSNVTKVVSRKELIYKKKLAGKFSFLPKSVKTFGKNVMSLVFIRKKNKLSKRQKKIIYDQLMDDMGKFKSEFGFPVEKWGF